MAKTKEQRELELQEKAKAKEARRKNSKVIIEPEDTKTNDINNNETVNEKTVVDTTNETGMPDVIAEHKKQILSGRKQAEKVEISEENKEEKRDEGQKDVQNITKKNDEGQKNTKNKGKNDVTSDTSTSGTPSFKFPEPRSPIPSPNNVYVNGFVYDLSDIIRVATAYNKGEISPDEMNEFGKTFIIRDYVPLLDKMTIIIAILTEHLYSTSNTQEVRLAELYKNLFFYGLLQGYALIDCRDIELTTYANYDLLYPIFGRFIKSYCEDDWKFFMEYIRDSINTYGVINITDTLGMIDTGAMKEATISNRQLITALQDNKELINELSSIAQIYDPNTKNLIAELQRIGVEQSKIDAITGNTDDRVSDKEKPEIEERFEQLNKINEGLIDKITEVNPSSIEVKSVEEIVKNKNVKENKENEEKMENSKGTVKDGKDEDDDFDF